MSWWRRFGIFSWPSGAKFSWSRAPPPKVMTMVFLFFAPVAPRTKGPALIRVDPKATPAASRRKSRRVRLRWWGVVGVLLIDLRGDWRAAWWTALTWRNRRIAELLLFPCRLRPCAVHGAFGKPQIPPGRDPSGRREHSPVRGGSGRQEDWDSPRGLSYIAEWISRIDADRRRDCPTARVLRQGWDRA